MIVKKVQIRQLKEYQASLMEAMGNATTVVEEDTGVLDVHSNGIIYIFLTRKANCV